MSESFNNEELDSSKKKDIQKKSTKKKTVKEEEINKSEEYKTLRNGVYTLLYYANKPFVSTELVLQFKGSKKSQIEKILDDLEKKNLITIKINGKSKVYYLNQSRLRYIDSERKAESQNENEANLSLKNSQEIDNSVNQKKSNKKTIEELKTEYNEIAAQLEEHKSECAELLQKKNLLENELSNCEMERKIKEYEMYIKENEGLNNCELIDKKEFDAMKEKSNRFKKLFSNRKKIYKNILDTVSEALGIKTKELLGEIGIDE
ncbi:hypothetical protein NUSPORA_01110 [Nucleospora cyclopteri]